MANFHDFSFERTGYVVRRWKEISQKEETMSNQGIYDECSYVSKNDADFAAHLRMAHSPQESANPKDLVGAKKPRLSLIPPAGLVYAALAMENGAAKYSSYNWREKKVQAMIYLEACMRHILSYQDGEDNARDSGLPHLAHALSCLLILIDAKETGNMIDNRPKPGAFADLVEKHTKK